MKRAAATILFFLLLRLFQVTLTCNLVLEGRQEEHESYSIFYGLDFDTDTSRNVELERLYVVKTQTDLAKLPVDFENFDFVQIYDRNFENSQARVHSLVNVVYLISKHLATSRKSLFWKPGDSRVRKSRKVRRRRYF